MLPNIAEAVKECNKGNADYRRERNGIRYCSIPDICRVEIDLLQNERFCPYQGGSVEIARTILGNSVVRYECNKKEEAVE